MATRRIGAARLDHGAQFFTTRDGEFADMVSDWVDAGVAREWCRGFGEHDGHPRYAGAGGMTSIAKHLAEGLDVRCGAMVFAVARRGGAWEVVIDDGSTLACDTVVVTAPIPQTYSLLVPAGVELPDELRSIDYDRTIGLLVALGGRPHLVGEPGGLQSPDEVFSFIADNQRKGVSDAAALTFHANAEWSLAHYDLPVEELAALLLDAAAPHIGPATVIEHQVKKWRFATPRRTWPERCWLDPGGTLALAGDAFAGPRLEGAALSGLAAARSLLGE